MVHGQAASEQAVISPQQEVPATKHTLIQPYFFKQQVFLDEGSKVLIYSLA